MISTPAIPTFYRLLYRNIILLLFYLGKQLVDFLFVCFYWVVDIFSLCMAQQTISSSCISEL